MQTGFTRTAGSAEGFETIVRELFCLLYGFSYMYVSYIVYGSGAQRPASDES